MTLRLAAPIGSARVIMVGDAGLMMKGRPNEYRHQGLLVVNRPTLLSALLELGRDRDCVVLVASGAADIPLTDFLDIVRTLAGCPVIVGTTPEDDPVLLAQYVDHGVACTVALPTTPTSLAQAVQRVPVSARTDVVLCSGNLILDDAQHRVTWFENRIELGAREFEILKYLMAQQPRLVSAQELAMEFGDKSTAAANRLRVAVGKIRVKLQSANPEQPRPIETVHKLGYRLQV